jgi:hypothetical protein
MKANRGKGVPVDYPEHWDTQRGRSPLWSGWASRSLDALLEQRFATGPRPPRGGSTSPAPLHPISCGLNDPYRPGSADRGAGTLSRNVSRCQATVAGPA